jgi:hypothetical protein
MDNDGDMDVLSASTNDDKIAWYENDGAADPSFTATTITTSADGAFSVFAADMDNDGDMDVLSASYYDDKIAWYESTLFLDIMLEPAPQQFTLYENYPNPFNPTTTLRFDLPEVSDITLTIYNVLGQEVKTFNRQSTPAGYHSITWDATNVGVGVYLYKLQTKNFVKIRKMMLLK